jgi:SAM-dependent methyltransferase
VSEPLPSTRRLFEHDRVASGYASARPYLHPELFALVGELTGSFPPAGRALDVGCGTGLSSLALLALAGEVVGSDASLEMLRRAVRMPGLRYAAAAAEALPFRSGAFDLLVSCGSMDWIDKERYLPRAAELLRASGWLVSADFGDVGRSPELDGLAAWYEQAFLGRFPRPPARDPIITDAEAADHGFARPLHRTFASGWTFSAAQYAGFLMTESNVIAAVEFGSQAARDVHRWLERELAPLFAGRPRRVAFGGYVQALRKT